MKRASIFCALVGACFSMTNTQAEVCPVNTAGPTICVAWNQPGEPIQSTNFEVDYETDPLKPDVELLTGGSVIWRVWSVDSVSPSSPGDFGRLIGNRPQNYRVLLQRSDESPAARHVESIILNPPGNFSSSILAGSRITGDVNGDVFVKALPIFNTEGTIYDLRIDGNVTGNITAYTIAKLVIEGNYGGGTIVANRLDALSLPGGSCNGDLRAGIEIQHDLRGSIDINGIIVGARIRVLGNVLNTASISITDILYGLCPEPAVCCPVLELNRDYGTTTGRQMFFDGLELADDVVIHGAFNSPGSIDFRERTIRGTLDLRGGGSASVHAIGRVTDGGTVNLGADSPVGYSGKASFGTIEDLPSIPDNSAVLTIGTLKGGVNIANDMSGQIVAEKLDPKAAIVVEGAHSGSIHVDGDSYGDVNIYGDISVTGTVTIRSSLKRGGRIICGGLCSGLIDIHRHCEKTSTIELNGLASSGQVLINSEQGDYDANGLIHVGPAEFVPPEGVVFDGSVRIRSGSNVGGDLNGRLEVVGCHATPDRIDICVCGANNGTVAIEQRGCANQAGWTCQSGCP